MTDDIAIQLHSTPDAAFWTDAWLDIIADNPSIPTDWGTMVGWFANAIEAGRLAAESDARKAQEEAGEADTKPLLVISSERRVPREVFNRLKEQLRAELPDYKLLVLESGLKVEAHIPREDPLAD